MRAVERSLLEPARVGSGASPPHLADILFLFAWGSAVLAGRLATTGHFARECLDHESIRLGGVFKPSSHGSCPRGRLR